MNFLQHTDHLLVNKSNRKANKCMSRWHRGDRMFRHTLPHSCYLILHFERPKALVDGVHYIVALVTGSPSVKAGGDDPVWTGEVRAPVQLEAIVHLLTAGATVPARVREYIIKMITHADAELFCSGELGSVVYLHINKKRIFFGLLEIWWQHHLIPKICWGKMLWNDKNNLCSKMFMSYSNMMTYLNINPPVTVTFYCRKLPISL